MMNRFAKTVLIAMMLLVLPMRQFGQQPQSGHNPPTIDFDITNISLFDERVFFLHNVMNDSRFEVINGEGDGVFVITASEAFGGIDLHEAFAEFREQQALLFAQMGKEEAAELASNYKAALPQNYILSLMMDVYNRSRQNNTCANADPFCTDNGQYQFPAGVNAGSGESGPDYDCLYTQPNPAWYYMQIDNPGNMDIHMYSTPNVDIDFCCWGPFSDPTAPCPNGLTENKVVSCSYSTASSEHCMIPASAQTGEYYILVITNYSNQSCNITFSKVGGSGTTNCGILPPLVSGQGPYCVGETIQLTAQGQSGATYSWTGPGGFNSNQQNPTRPNCTMAMAGVYTCTITVGGQSNSASTPPVVIYPQPTANFNYTSVCKGTPTQFNSTSTTNPGGQQIQNYQWNFGDGQTGTGQNASHTYTNSGNYQVTLTVSTGNGHCAHSRTQTVPVYAMPMANAGNDQYIAYGATAQLHGSGGAGSFNYQWSPANMVTNPNAQNTQTVPLTQDQTYTLTVTNQQGQCIENDQVTIRINGNAMAVSAGPDIAICQGGSGEIYVVAGGGTGVFTYSWTPTTGLSNPNIANPIASPSQTTTYTCQVSDGQTSQNVSVTVTVNDVIIENEYVSICPGEEYHWHGVSYNHPNTYQFDTITAQGCDKTIYLHLENYPSYDETTITEAICFGESYDFYGTTYTSSINTSYTDQTVNGCDSIVRLNLTVYPDNGVTLHPVVVCPEQLPYTFYGVDYYEDTDIIVHDTDIHGCDSLVRLNLTISNYYIPPVQTEYVCWEGTPSYLWEINGETYYESDIYIDTIPTANCDGIFRLDLHMMEKPEVTTIQETACDSYDWYVNGVKVGTYTQSGNYHHSIPIYEDPNDPSTKYPCDQEYELALTIHYSRSDEKSYHNECDSIPFNWFGETQYLKRNGIYTFEGETFEGCDSLMTVTVTDMKYTPQPEKIGRMDEGESGPILLNDTTFAVITNTQFFSFNYDFYINEAGLSRWTNCVWTISEPEWSIDQRFDAQNNASYCKVHVKHRNEEDVVLTATATSACGAPITKKAYLRSTFFDVDEQTQDLSDVTIVPNPNNGKMRLNFENMEGRLYIKVFDMRGNLIDDFNTQVAHSGSGYEYDMKRFADGVYFFVISNHTTTLTRKAVIIH